MKLRYFAIFMSIIVLSGCETVRMIPSDIDNTGIAITGEYKIGVGDTLDIKVWKNGELSVSVPVRPDGNISVPLVGDIHAEGVSAESLASGITAKLESFIRSPQVTVIVTNPTSAEYLRRIRLTGAVVKPTSIPFQKGMTVMDIILLVGGVTPFADANDTKLYRTSLSGSNVYPVYLDDILKKGDLSSNYNLMPNDIITVPERVF
jgi:polysaccharide export outer membrane protein